MFQNSTIFLLLLCGCTLGGRCSFEEVDEPRKRGSPWERPRTQAKCQTNRRAVSGGGGLLGTYFIPLVWTFVKGPAFDCSSCKLLLWFCRGIGHSSLLLTQANCSIHIIIYRRRGRSHRSLAAASAQWASRGPQRLAAQGLQLPVPRTTIRKACLCRPPSAPSFLPGAGPIQLSATI